MRYMTLHITTGGEGNNKMVVGIDHIVSLESTEAGNTMVELSNGVRRYVKEDVDRIINMIDSHRY